MRREIVLALLISGSAFSGANAYCVGWDTSRPNYDPRYYSVSREFKRAKYIVDVRTVREVWLGEDGKPKPLKPPFQFGYPRPWGFDPYYGVIYTVEVVSAYKGDPPDWLRIFSENTNGRFWQKVGKRYILFLTERNFDNSGYGQPRLGSQLTVDNCGNSAWLPEARKLEKKLEALSLKAGRSLTQVR